MKANANLLLILAVFFWIADAAYITWSLLDPVHIVNVADGEPWYRDLDWVGAIAIFLSGILAAFISFYVGRVHKGQGGELPEDRPEALIDDGDAEQGFFSPWSWWPVLLAGSAAIVFIGVAIGFWISFIGGAVLVISLVGWQYEYYRGYFSH